MGYTPHSYQQCPVLITAYMTPERQEQKDIPREDPPSQGYFLLWLDSHLPLAETGKKNDRIGFSLKSRGHLTNEKEPDLSPEDGDG